MDASNQIAAILLALFSGALLSAPLAALLLRMFRRSLERGMIARVSGTAQSGSFGRTYDGAGNPSRPSLTIRTLDGSARGGENSDLQNPVRRAQRSLRRSILVYVLAGLAYALLFGIGLALQLPEGIMAWRRVLGLTVHYFWPTVLAIAIIATTSRFERLRLALFYFVVFAGFSAFSLATSPKLTARQLLLLWILTNGPATFLMLAFLRRRVRAVGPLVMAFLTFSVFGAFMTPGLIFRNESWLRKAAAISVATRLGGTAIFYVVLIIGFLACGLFSWWLLRRFAELYRRKKLSEQSLTLDSLFFVFALEQSLALDPSGAHIYVGIAAFVLYRAVIGIDARYVSKRQQAVPATRQTSGAGPPVLLHLRVFSLQKRSEELFDGLTKLWRRVGSIVMIAGPDLIRTTVEPYEFLEFLGGKMSRRFVLDDADLTRRITELDHRPDPDGRYRVNQFFCHQDTWQMTISRLVKQSTAVLMDLRSFSPRNQGCVFELGQLLNAVDLARVVFLIDSTTDREFLGQTLQNLWKRVQPESPNLSNPAPVARIFLEQAGMRNRANLLFRELLNGAEFCHRETLSPEMIPAA